LEVGRTRTLSRTLSLNRTFIRRVVLLTLALALAIIVGLGHCHNGISRVAITCAIAVVVGGAVTATIAADVVSIPAHDTSASNMCTNTTSTSLNRACA
jgi:hypothetical protein